MNYQNNQQGQLPFNPRQPTSNLLNISLNNPPHVPNFQVEQWLQSSIPLIAAASAMEIQNRAQANPLRMFMFNQYSRNNFANPDFDALVVGIAEFITMASKKNTYPNVEIAIQDSIPKMVEMLCAVNLRSFPQLEREVDQQTINAVRNTVNHFDRICHEIKQMQYQQPNQYQQQPQQQNWAPQNNMGNYPQQNNNQGGFSNTPLSGYNNRGQVQPPQGQPTSLFGGSQQNAIPAQTGQTMGGKYGGDNNPITQPFTPRTPTPAPQTQQVQQVQQPVSTVNEVLASEVTWVPSERYPYYPAYNPLKYVMYIRTEADGTLTPVLKERTENMDYDRHSVSTVFGPVPKKLDLSNSANIMLQIEEGVKLINADSKNVQDHRTMKAISPEETNELVTTCVNQKTYIETSENEAWFEGSIDRLKINDGKIPAVYRVYVRITDPIITMVDESAVVVNFGNSKTFIELREKMDSATGEISAELWGAANMRMTNLINRILRLNMSLPTIAIESFVTDIQDLITLLETNYGASIQTAFLKYQKEEIASTFKTLSEETAVELTAMCLQDKGFDKDNEPKITFITSDYSLTYMNCLSHELELDMAAEVGSAITNALTPMMFSLAEGLFNDIDARGNNFAKHLIRTNDGRIMEIAKGNIGDGFYTVMLTN